MAFDPRLVKIFNVSLSTKLHRYAVVGPRALVRTEIGWESSVANPDLGLFGTPVRGWEVDLPEVGGGRIEF